MNSEKFQEEYKKLNPKQKEAVDAIAKGGPVMVVAGPGSGKTEILALGVANILQKSSGTRPGDILCLTFTDAAAVNMRKRLEQIIGADAFRVAVYTFHSFSTSIIERHPEYFYDGASFSSADTLVQIEVVEGILRKLSHSNPLSALHPEMGYAYAYDIRQSISHLKKAGITPDEFEKILEHNNETAEYVDSIIGEVLSDRVSKRNTPRIIKVADEIKKHKFKDFPSADYRQLSSVVADSLFDACKKSEEGDSTTPISEWKQKNTDKSESGKRVLKDTTRFEKMMALANIYRDYRKELNNRGYYDFDDMILDVIQALKKHGNLLSELQEQFQYILVDEFQDTNDAQTKIVKLIANAPVNEGRPNLMVVGDDDQAIFKFQGALVSNILDFKREYVEPVIIIMGDNYRSTQEILNVARFVIAKGKDRLENLLPGIEKKLTASNGTLKKGKVSIREFPSVLHEYYFVANEISLLIKSGVSPSSIAVIGRKHEQLESLVPSLYKFYVPIKYERQQNVFHEPNIHELIQISRFISTLARKERDAADDLLPEILSYRFWGIDRKTIWKISLEANKERKSWMEIMENYPDRNVKTVKDFLLDVSIQSLSDPLEYVFDRLIGEHVVIFDKDEDFEPVENIRSDKYVSPFKDFYFSEKKFKENKTEYLTFLSSLRTFMLALREYRKGLPLSIDDLVSFVDIHEKNEVLVTDNSPFVTAKNAVNLLTVHKAKGLEFEYVFLLGCQDNIWASKGMPRKLSFPLNLPISPAGDTEDDQLRLFYVALTRAKRFLYITYHTTGDNGKELSKLRFLSTDKNFTDDSALTEILSSANQETITNLPDPHEVLMDSWRTYHKPPVIIDENALLETIVADYQMSVTHLDNFLNVKKGGPQFFFEQNLLRFPQAKSVSGAFGSSMHEAVESVYISLRHDDKLPSVASLLTVFENALKKERLNKIDFEKQKERGFEALKVFYRLKKDTFKLSDKIEVNFKHQGVVIEGAHLTGKIDKMSFEGGGEIKVLDFKTGKASISWDGDTLYEKIKLRSNARQLMFYKLLVENSREYNEYKVSHGVIEYLEPEKDKIIDLPYEMVYDEIKRLEKLIGVVFKKIITLDFPPVNNYPKDVSGITSFENDLLEGKV